MANPTDFPRDFPTAHAATVGRVLMRQEEPSKRHLFPLYSLQGYGMGLFADGDEPTPGPFGAGLEMSEHEAGSLLVDASEFEGYGDDPSKKALPWKLILRAVAKIIAGLV